MPWLLAGMICPGVLLAAPAAGSGAPTSSRSGAPIPASSPPWSAGTPFIQRAVAGGAPLVIEVLVPLCSNAQIWCGADFAGQPARPATNLYWGAVFGARRILERPGSGWERLAIDGPEGAVLERAVYRRWVAGGPWGSASSPGESKAAMPVEVIAVLEAIDGDRIDEAVARLYERSTRGSRVTVPGRAGPRELVVHAVGYAGHNRLLDGLPFPPQPSVAVPVAVAGSASGRPAASAYSGPIPAFVLACYSERTFTPVLRSAGVETVVATQALMAPEGYVVDAVLQGLAANEPARSIRQRAARATARWQRIPEAQASALFAPR